jgi:hypothetical protein
VTVDVLPDLTTWTRHGPVDIVVVDRFLRGDHDVPLTAAERDVVVHVSAAAGVSASRISDWLHENERTVKRTLSTPAPVDRLGRPFHLTA